MGGKLGVVSVFEEKRRLALKDDAASAADTQDDCFSQLHNAFSYALKPQPDGSSAVLWTQHVAGVDVPQDQLSKETLDRLQDWWQKRQAERAREKELQKIEATIAYLSKAPDSGAVVGTFNDERLHIEEEKRTIEKEENKLKEEKKNVAQLAAAANERDRKEQAQISHKIEQLKHEQVSHVIRNVHAVATLVLGKVPDSLCCRMWRRRSKWLR
jgi:hypothetical protein